MAFTGLSALADADTADMGASALSTELIIKILFIIPRPNQQKHGPKSLDEVDPKLLETYKKLGIPLHEQGRLSRCCGGCGI